MEKYTGFCDLVTGINPYVRITKYHFSMTNFILQLGILKAFLLFPLFIYRSFTNSFVTVKDETQTKAILRQKRVFLSTFSSIYDLSVLHRIIENPSIYILRNKKLISISRFNVLKDAEKIEGKNIVFLMGGGVTNGEIFLNPAEFSKIADIQQYISISYSPSVSYDINFFDIFVLPQFRSSFVALFYHLLYFTTVKTQPISTVTTAETIYELSEKTKKEISLTIDSEVTEKFLGQFNFD